MAIEEACQVWIEQRIEEELAEKGESGKSLRAIGRDIAEEIERIFKAKVKPGTIYQKVRRSEGGTNVPPEKNTQEKSEKMNSNEIKQKPVSKDGTLRGEKREGSGKPKQEEIKPENRFEARKVSDAISFAWMAISQLERIREDDPKREEAFHFVQNWINERKGAKK